MNAYAPASHASLIVFLAQRDLPAVAIAELIGTSVSYVHKALHRAREEGITVRIKPCGRTGPGGKRLKTLDNRETFKVSMTISRECMETLFAAARGRRLAVATLCAALLETAADEGLIDAILDDGGAA